MKPQILLIFAFVMACVVQNSQAQEVNALLADKALVQREIRCILKKGPCDAIGRQIIQALPEALHNNCRRCTPYQARNARRLISFMKQSHPREWNQILNHPAYRA